MPRLGFCMNSRLTNFFCVAALLSMQFAQSAYAQTEEELLSGLPTEEPTATAAPASASDKSSAAKASQEANETKEAKETADNAATFPSPAALIY